MRCSLGKYFCLWLIPIKPFLMENGYKFVTNKVNEAKIEQFELQIEQKREEMFAQAGFSKFMKSKR